MCANVFTMHSADTCIFRDPYMTIQVAMDKWLDSTTELQ